MAWTSDDLAAVDEAIATGAYSVKVGDKQVTYRNQSELFALRDRMARSIESPARGRRMTRQAIVDRDLG